MRAPAKTYIFDVPDSSWMTANSRFGHWSQTSKRAAVLRRMGAVIGSGWPRAQFKSKVRVDVTVHLRNNRRFDPLNVEPTVKPLLDGLVDAGVLIDDSFEYVEGPHLKAGAPIYQLPVGTRRLVFDFYPLGDGEFEEE